MDCSTLLHSGQIAMARSAPVRPPPPPPTVSSPTRAGFLREILSGLSIVDLLVFLASEGMGLPLAFAGAEAATNELLRPALIGFGFGLPLMALRFAFPFVKPRLSEAAREKISKIAVFCTTVTILSAFAYVVGPSIYREVVPQIPSPSVQSSSSFGTPPPSPIAPVRIDITGENFLPIAAGGNLQANFYFANRSPRIAALGVLHGGKMIISPRIMTADEERAIALLYFTKDDFPGDNIASETPPGASGSFYTVNSDIDDDHLKPVLEGKAFLYVFTYVKYGDRVSGLLTETEWCSWYSGNLAVANGCLTFNRVFSAAPKKPYIP